MGRADLREFCSFFSSLLRLRFDEKTRGVNAISFATMTVFSSGISMYAMAKLTQMLRIVDAPLAIFHFSIILSALIEV